MVKILFPNKVMITVIKGKDFNIYLAEAQFNSIIIKIPVSGFVDINKLILELIWKGKRLCHILKKKSEGCHYQLLRLTIMLQ